MFLWFPSKGRYAHTGFVKQVDGDWIVTVEGNSNAAGSRTGGSVVSLRRRWAGTKTVFGRPLYAAAPAAPAPPPPAAAPATGLVLRRGAKGGEVRRLQDTLRARGFDPGRTDGDFGTRTDAAVRAFQRARGLAVDGVVGPRTWGALG